MIRDLLDFTQARLGGGLPVHRESLDIHDLVEHVVEESQLAYPDREIAHEHGGDGRGEWDSDRLSQVVTNLLTNALHYSPATASVRVTTKSDDSHVRLEVCNGGAPIPSDVLPILFQPMHRGTTKVDKTTRSIGLGLFIVDQIVRAHGGSVEVRSTLEEGTVFAVRLPRNFAQGEASKGV